MYTVSADTDSSVSTQRRRQLLGAVNDLGTRLSWVLVWVMMMKKREHPLRQHVYIVADKEQTLSPRLTHVLVH